MKDDYPKAQIDFHPRYDLVTPLDYVPGEDQASPRTWKQFEETANSGMSEVPFIPDEDDAKPPMDGPLEEEDLINEAWQPFKHLEE